MAGSLLESLTVVRATDWNHNSYKAQVVVHRCHVVHRPMMTTLRKFCRFWIMSRQAFQLRTGSFRGSWPTFATLQTVPAHYLNRGLTAKCPSPQVPHNAVRPFSVHHKTPPSRGQSTKCLTNDQGRLKFILDFGAVGQLNASSAIGVQLRILPRVPRGFEPGGDVLRCHPSRRARVLLRLSPRVALPQDTCTVEAPEYFTSRG